LVSRGLFKREDRLEPALLDVVGSKISRSFRRNSQARRLIIRPARGSGSFIVTLPPRASRREALEFANRCRVWIAARLRTSPQTVPLAAGSNILFHGREHAIVHRPGIRGSVWHDAHESTINVAGEAQHLPRRLRDWLKQQAKRDLGIASLAYAEAMEVKIRRITVRDQSSRWGSCSAEGHLSYSWRLVLAPEFVLDYVAAHEVAHLRHMDHSPRYWRLVLAHCQRAREAQQWLKRNGALLHRYML
jgi:predicted metal-dependent hydrolase